MRRQGQAASFFLVDESTEDQRQALLGSHNHRLSDLTNFVSSRISSTTLGGDAKDEENEWRFSKSNEVSSERNVSSLAPTSRITSVDIDDEEQTASQYEAEQFRVNLLDSKRKVNNSKADSWKVLWCSSMRLQCRIFLYFAALASITFLLYATLSRDSTTFAAGDRKSGLGSKEGDDKDAFAKPPPARVKVDVYMESQCPDTTKFINSQLMPVYDELQEHLDLKIIPFGKAKWTKLDTPLEDYTFQCQHGPRECLVNQVMCCGMERLKTVEKYLPYVACVQATPPGGHEQEKCDEKFSLPHKEIQECANGREGRLLHHRMGELTKHLRPPPFFIPWITIDGAREKRALTELKEVVCEKLVNNFNVKPEPCKLALLLPVSTSVISSRLRARAE